jgi:5-methylcytosine-specific restriction endonuclease McrA
LSNIWKKPKKVDKRRLKNRLIDVFSKKSNNEVASIIKGVGSTLPNQKSWVDLKKQVHKKYGYQCMCCGHMPSHKKYSNIDHIKPRKFFPELALDFDNLQVLCGRCNKEKGNKHCTDYRQVIHNEVLHGEFSDYNIGRMLKQL